MKCLLATVWCVEAGKKFLMSSDLTKCAAKSLFMMQSKKLQQSQVCLVSPKASFPFKGRFFLFYIIQQNIFPPAWPQLIRCQQSDVPFKLSGLT